MVLEKFRITHSTLIEHYQFIEAHLEGIYAAVCGKPLTEGLKDVAKDGLNGILQDILWVEKRKKIDVLSDEECRQLRDLFQRRNFWCHSCYYDLVFDRKTGGLAKIEDVQRLLQDLKDAERWRDELYRKKISLMMENREELLRMPRHLAPVVGCYHDKNPSEG